MLISSKCSLSPLEPPSFCKPLPLPPALQPARGAFFNLFQIICAPFPQLWLHPSFPSSCSPSTECTSLAGTILTGPKKASSWRKKPSALIRRNPVQGEGIGKETIWSHCLCGSEVKDSLGRGHSICWGCRGVSEQSSIFVQGSYCRSYRHLWKVLIKKIYWIFKTGIMPK